MQVPVISVSTSTPGNADTQQCENHGGSQGPGEAVWATPQQGVFPGMVATRFQMVPTSYLCTK